MSAVKHLSMRVPWRDQPWDEHLCQHPLDNSSCLLLRNVGPKRDDDFEVAHHGADIGTLDANRLPCLSERGTFMSPGGYTVTKEHPYRFSPVLADHLGPTVLSVPGHAFEAVPFRWLARETFESDIWPDWQTAYDPDAEARVHELIKHRPRWIMDGANQHAVIEQFFEPVVEHESLVFAYLKHSPFQDETPRRLLVGAATVTGVQLPGDWNQEGTSPFSSAMWETVVRHSLRADQAEGILLPYQQLLAKLEAGADVDAALAWAPEGANLEFSYVTEHVSSDTAIDALQSLRDAADGMRALGIDVPDAGVSWVDAALLAQWEERGAVPGLASVLSHLQVERAHVVSRALHHESPAPWTVLEAGFADASSWPAALAGRVHPNVGREWQQRESDERTVLKLLSTMDLRPDQVRLLMEHRAAIELDPSELLADPYLAATCTYEDPERIGFATVDRALFPTTAPCVVTRW